MEYEHGFAVVSVLFLFAGFFIGTASVAAAQLCFVLAAAAAGVGIKIAIKSGVHNVTKRRF